MGSSLAPNALPWMGSCPAPKAPPWVGSCLASKTLPWVDSCSAPLAESLVLGWLVPFTEHAALGRLSLTSTAFHDFRTHEPRITIDFFSDPPGRFVARFLLASPLPNAVPAASRFPLPLTAFSIRILPCPPRGSPGSTEAMAAAPTIAQSSFLLRSSAQETDSVASLAAAADPRRPPRLLLLPPLRSPPYRSRPTVTSRGLLGLLYYDLRPLLATRQVHLQS